MYSIIKNVIDRGGYDLSDMLTKIKSLWVDGSITDEQKGELIQSAQNGATPKNSVDLMMKLEEMDRRLKVLEEKGADSTDNASEFVAGKWYYAGDVCVLNGDKYMCVVPDGVVCVWSPADYPAYWEKA